MGAAHHRREVIVAGVAAPAQLRAPAVEGVLTDRFDVVHHRRRGAAFERQNLIGIDAKHHLHRITFTQRQAHEHLERAAVGGILRNVEVGVIELPIPHVVTQRQAVIGEIRVHIREVVALLVGALGQRHRHPIAGAEEVVFRKLQRQVEAGQLRIANTGRNTAGSGFFDGVSHVHLIVGAGHWLAVHIHGFEVAQSVQAHLAAVDRRLRIPAAFELAHLAAQHRVSGARIALEHDAAHVHTRAGLYLKINRYGALVAVDRGHRIHLGEGVADVGQTRGDRVGCQLQQPA